MTVLITRSPVRSARRQRGQALAEAVVALALLVPLFLLIPMLGKYAHIEQAVQQAARTAAWEAIATQDFNMDVLEGRRTDLEALAIERHFGDADAAIASVPSDPGDATHLGDPMLNTFSDQPLVRRQDVTLRAYEFEDEGGVIDTVTGYMPDVVFSPFPPSDGKLTVATVSVDAQNLRTKDGSAPYYLRPFDQLDLEFQASHTLLADSWNAAGSGINGDTGEENERSVYSQVAPLAFATHLEPVGEIFDDLEFLEWVPLLGQIFKLRLGYGRDVVDIVPHDRLEDWPGTP